MRWPEWAWRATFAGLILVGVVVRLRQYLVGRSLWLDEAMLALNLVGRSFGGLVRPLDYDQGAPLGFLFAEKLVITLLGKSEYAFRLIPLGAACLGLLLLYFWAKRLTGRLGLVFTLGIIGVSDYIVFYAATAKQYASDLTLALVLYLLAFRFFYTEAKRRDFVFLALGGMGALWFSHPALFTLGGIGLALLIQYAARKDRPRLVSTLVVGLLWGLNFGLLYLVQFRGLAANSALTGYWAEYFMPLPPWSNWAWFPGILTGLWINPLGLFEPRAVPMALFLVGLVALFRRHWQWSLTFVVSILLTLVASALREYPFGARMILFLMPGFALGVGEGLEWLCRQAARIKFPVIGWAVGVILLGFMLQRPVAFAWENFTAPKMTEEIRPMMAYLENHYKPGDVIYVYPGAVPAFRFYAADYGFGPSDYVAGTGYNVEMRHYLNEVDQFIGKKRVWLLFSHIFENKGLNERDYILAHLDQIGQKERQYFIPGTSVYLYLYDLSK